MSEFRSIDKVLAPPPPNMVGDGFRVHHFFPNDDLINESRMSPFIMLDYNSKFVFSPSDHPRGVGVHPHRGFETVTVSFQGKIAHHDSAGNSGIIEDGDVQWMTAASGILHKEYHEEQFSKQGGVFHMAQLWVNLPSKYKMTSPKYQEISHSKMAIHPLKSGRVEIIAGNYKGIKGPASTFSPVHLYKIILKKGDVFHVEFPPAFNCCALVVEGNIIEVSNTIIEADHLVLFNNDGQNIQFTTDSEAILLLMAGEPIQEPIASYGPFVMNTHEEIQQAFKDFREGKFGYLAD